MRIISDFHDYYDCIQGMGQDLDTVYFRKPKAEPYKKDKLKFPRLICHGSTFWNPSFDLHISEIMVGFCGRVYPMLKMTTMSGKSDFYCYNTEEVDRFVQNNYRKKHINAYNTKTRTRSWKHGRNWPLYARRYNIAGFFKDGEKQQDAHKQIFIDHNCPIFVVKTNIYLASGEQVITYNARLINLQFYRIFNNYAAFQEIYSYISNLAQPEKPIPKISEKDMRDAKGFDDWSFKKLPTKHKKKTR